jgi:putative sigma-54 modulation protein
MKIEYYWKHMDTSPAVEDYAHEKFAKLDKYVHQMISAHVTFSVDHDKKIVKMTLHADGHDFVAEIEDDDVYAGIDRLEDKMKKMLRRHHDKTASH